MTPGPSLPVADSVDCLPVFTRVVSAANLVLPHVDKFEDAVQSWDNALLLKVLRAHCSAMAPILMVQCGGIHILGSKLKKDQKRGHGPDSHVKEQLWEQIPHLIKLADDSSSCQHPDYNLRRDPEPEPLSSATSKFLTHKPPTVVLSYEV